METRLKQSLSTQELIDLMDRARQILPDFRLLPEQNGNSAEFSGKKMLKDLNLPSGVRSINVKLVMAKFKPKNNPGEELGHIAVQAEPHFGEFGSFEVKLHFQPGVSEDAERLDEAGILHWRGKLFFAYECRIESRALRAGYFKQLIERTGLPISMSEDQRGFYLKHTKDGLLRPLTTGIFNESPMSFWCELVEQSVPASLPFIKAAVGDAPVSALEWQIVPGEENHLALESVLAQNFPSTSFEINFTYRLDNLDVLEQLRGIKISSGCFYTDVAAFTLDGELSVFQVRTNTKGHALYADIPEGALDELNQKVGVTFVPC